jgi:DNA polymerase III subunit beta
VFDIEPELLKISAHTPDLGIGHEEVNIVLEGDPLKIAFNGRYIVDVLSTLDCEEIVLNFQDDSRSAQLSISDSLDFRYVLMPVKLRESVQEEVAS